MRHAVSSPWVVGNKSWTAVIHSYIGLSNVFEGSNGEPIFVNQTIHAIVRHVIVRQNIFYHLPPAPIGIGSTIGCITALGTIGDDDDIGNGQLVR
mmetsp:Transcript_10562/g.18980  ORF Transcript_10562/g.18980 Transcript_10562/m.18980 type:complete len:95 (+) Transcript_10562:47-331(+)